MGASQSVSMIVVMMQATPFYQSSEVGHRELGSIGLVCPQLFLESITKLPIRMFNMAVSLSKSANVGKRLAAETDSWRQCVGLPGLRET